MSTHTPGPWKATSVSDGKELHYFIAPNGHASVAEADNMANARLIAAAPELLEATRIALKYLIAKNTIKTVDIENALGDAIKKAEGR